MSTKSKQAKEIQYKIIQKKWNVNLHYYHILQLTGPLLYVSDDLELVIVWQGLLWEPTAEVSFHE